MVELASRYNSKPVLLKEIAGKEDISAGYLEQILPLLKAARLVNSIRGPHGGYSLAKPPTEITIKEIVEALEGPIQPVYCVESPSECQRSQFCVTRDIWIKLGENISKTLESMTLDDMVQMRKDRQNLFASYNI